jgi:hypothetical protein
MGPTRFLKMATMIHRKFSREIRRRKININMKTNTSKEIVRYNVEKFVTEDYWIGVVFTMFSWISSFIMSVATFLSFTLVIVLVDLYTGRMAAKHRGEAIKSSGYRQSVKKYVLYMLGILYQNYL